MCLSILGTWRGEGWSSCFNIQSISLELQSLLDENPITNEPSFENETGELSKLYIFMIRHMNIRVSVIGMLRNTPDKYIPVRHKMIEYFLNHFDAYVKVCDEYKTHKWNKKILTFKLYKWKEYINYDILKESRLNCSSFKFQKTPPGGGYHIWHAEQNEGSMSSRCLFYIMYLNDIQDSGETEFIYQKIRIPSKKNTCVISPASFTHAHRGNPVFGEESKYVVTGWFYFS